MDGSRFDAWTRRQFGAAAAGAAAGLFGLDAREDVDARRGKKKKKRKKGRSLECEPLRTRCNPHNRRELCCGGLACGVVADLQGHRCCRLRYGECQGNEDCCNNLRCIGSAPGYCDA